MVNSGTWLTEDAKQPTRLPQRVVPVVWLAFGASKGVNPIAPFFLDKIVQEGLFKSYS